jgi:C4-dicarboxylate-specific signal transduction histidine kinase
LYADGLLSDITERKRAEEERKELQQKAELTSRLASIGQMASGIAHEVNNPLTSVISLTEVLAQKNLPEDINEDIEIIHEAAQRVAGIVNRLLTFARQQKPERTHVDINTVIQDTLALRAYALETGHIKVTSQLAPNLPRTMADAAQLQQVFLNIILNAETAMKSVNGKGNLLIRTERINNTLRICFTDDGPGIAKENLTKVFEPFFTTKEVGQGTGLGLSICHGIVAAHNGQIYARSQSDRGPLLLWSCL